MPSPLIKNQSESAQVVAEASTIARYIRDTFSVQSKAAHVRDLVKDYLVGMGITLTDTQLYEIVEDLLPLVVQALRDFEDEALRANKTISYKVIAETAIIGRLTPRPGDSEETRRQREIESLCPQIAEHLGGLTPAEFEDFCKAFLKLLGSVDAIKTQLSHDEGVDFCGHLPLHAAVNQSAEQFVRDVKLFIVGQAKRLKSGNQVGVAVIRELIGTARIVNYEAEEFGQRWGFINRLRACDAVLCLLLTTGSFSPYSEALANRTGVVLRDLKQIVLLLASNGIGIHEDVGQLIFDSKSFNDWLKSAAQ